MNAVGCEDRYRRLQGNPCPHTVETMSHPASIVFPITSILTLVAFSNVELCLLNKALLTE